MSSSAKKSTAGGNAMLVAIFAAALLVVFVAFRSSDLLKLPTFVVNLGGGPLFGGEGFVASIVGAVVSGLILVSWFGTGTFVFRYLKVESGVNHSHVLELVRNIAVGAIITSLIWFFLGLAGLYSPLAAIIVVAVGLVEGGLSLVRVREARVESRVPEKATGFDKALLLLIAVPVGLAFIAALAPPIAKDTLLYHFAVPKAFIAQHSNTFIEGNIASYLALGTEMHAVWAMLLGNLVSPRAGEAAAGATMFLFFPLVLATVFGWARELDISRRWSLVAVLMVAAIPTAFHVASSAYIDLSLALYITLACYSLTRWWKTLATGSLVMVAVFLGGALAVKLTTVFVIAAFALIILLRARDNKKQGAVAPGSEKTADGEEDSQAVERRSKGAGKVVLAGLAALLLAGVIASPWYLRNWSTTGSPVFPFYMSIWPGTATGWDIERSNLFQGMNSQYGGASENKINYLIAPARVSLAAQPEDANLYDGVLGAAFLIGLPLLIWAIWRKKLSVELLIAVGVAGIVYLFWLFSSQQLRYLLPIVPLLAIATAAAAESVTEVSIKRAWMYSFAGASLLGVLTTFAWFCQKAPVRVALGGETRDLYLTRNIDYYPYYQTLNTETATDAKVWLINMRRDTYNIERPVFSDYLFEDWTFGHLVKDSQDSADVRSKVKMMGFAYVLARHDILLDYRQSAILSDEIGTPTERTEIAKENARRLRIARDFILDPANTVRSDNKFSLVKVF